MKYAVLDRLYDQVLAGLPVLGTPEAVARRFQTLSAGDAARRLDASYTTLCGGAGFAFGLPGLLTAPVTVPANVAGVLLLQLHLCAATAAARGRDPHEAAVREACIACVMRRSDADSQRDETESLLARLGTKIVERGIRVAAEQAPRFLRHSARSLPLMGGVIGGATDAYATREVARAARAAFAPGMGGSPAPMPIA